MDTAILGIATLQNDYVSLGQPSAMGGGLQQKDSEIAYVNEAEQFHHLEGCPFEEVGLYLRIRD